MNYKYKNQVVVASSKEEAILEILALKEDELSPYTKALYEVMNEGSFQYSYRIDDNFNKFMKTTMLDEIKDVIKSDKNLIRQCVEKRVKSYSIVWNALFQVFNYVKKMHNCRAVVDNRLMKRWFEFNHTDYKTALKPIVDYVETELRPELRETEKVTSATKHNVIEELCDLAKSDKNKADAIFKALTKDYNTSLDCMLASQYLAKEFKYDVKNADFWVQGFRKLYEEKGVDFLCKVLRDLKLGSSPIGCGACNSILKSLYNKFIGVKAMADTECFVYYREPENMSVFLPLDKDNVITHSLEKAATCKDSEKLRNVLKECCHDNLRAGIKCIYQIRDKATQKNVLFEVSYKDVN